MSRKYGNILLKNYKDSPFFKNIYPEVQIWLPKFLTDQQVLYWEVFGDVENQQSIDQPHSIQLDSLHWLLYYGDCRNIHFLF